LLDVGVYGTVDELAQKEKIAASYASRVLRLSLLAPDIVEAILDGRQPADIQLEDLLEGFPLGWAEQHTHLAISGPRAT